MRAFRTALAAWQPPVPTQWQARTFVDTPLLTHRATEGVAAQAGPRATAAPPDDDDSDNSSVLTDLDDLDADILD
jgi:hypothetical protein